MVEHFLGKEEVIGSSPIISSCFGGIDLYVSSLIGRAAVSKTAGWGFDSLLTCTQSKIITVVYSRVAFMNKYIGKANQYYRDVVGEMRKVVWPSREEIKDLTIVVLTVSGILALFTFLVDWVINFVMGKLL